MRGPKKRAQKACKVCQRVKPRAEFPVSDKAKGWVRSECRACYNAIQLSRYYARAKREVQA